MNKRLMKKLTNSKQPITKEQTIEAMKLIVAYADQVVKTDYIESCGYFPIWVHKDRHTGLAHITLQADNGVIVNYEEEKTNE